MSADRSIIEAAQTAESPSDLGHAGGGFTQHSRLVGR